MNGLDDLKLQRRIDALLEPWRGPGAGVTIGVVLDGELRVHRHAGMANVEHAVPIGPETRFRIASVSKQFTCAAILALEAEGRLRLDDPAHPDLPGITVAHLMHNTAGIRDMLELIRHGGGDLGTPVTSVDLLDALLRQRTLNFEPGTRFLYSNSNFFLLGLLVERLTARPLGTVLAERFFTPLGLADTRLTPDTAEAIPRLATGYQIKGGTWSRARHAFPLGGEGGLVSSVTDLAIWSRHLPRALATQTPFANGHRNRYARGLTIRPHRGIATWSHGGLWPGYRTEFLLAPDLGIAVVAIANRGDVDPNLLAHRALDIVLDGRPGVHPVPPLPPAPPPGRFIDPATDTTLDIAVADAVTLTANGLPITAEPTEDGRFASPRASSVFAVRPAGPDAVEVEQDAGTVGIWHRAPPDPALPDDLPGTYRSDEIAAGWHVAERDGRLTIVARGPVATGPAWELEPVAPDLFRVFTPGTLYRSWIDVRCVRDGGRLVALLASGGRVKRVRYDRVSDPAP